MINQTPTTTIGSNSPVCSGDTIKLTSGGGTTYNWSGPLFSSSIQNPNILNSTTASSGNYIVTVTGVGGCSSTAQTSVLVNQIPTVIPTSNSPICAGSDLNLQSGGTGINYSWSGPSTFTSTDQNPIITSASTSATGIYKVTITNALGCTASAQTSVTINTSPIPAVSGDTSICMGETTTLTVTGGSTYTWNGTAGDSITVSPTVNTTYLVVASNAQGCTQSTTVLVNVSNLIVNAQNAISDTCSRGHGSLSISVSNGLGPYTYQWNNIPVDSSTVNNLSAGTYLVTITDNAGCSITSSIVLPNIPLPILTLTNVVDDHCFKGLGQASIVASGGTGVYTYNWNTIPTQVGASANNLVAGTYVVYVNDEYCMDSAVVVIGKIPGPSASFETNPTGPISPNLNVHFENYSSGGISYHWSFGDGEESNSENATHAYITPHEYNVILEAIDQYGCVDTVSHTITIVEEINIHVPNSFSPDGDGVNDIFRPYGEGYSLSGYEMYIYDRWGELLFSSNDFNFGWDGKIKGATLTTNEVFVYKILVKSLSGKSYQYTGHITLLGSENKF